jgi:hypothetical protein
MTRKPAKPGIQRIKLDAQGYDANGAYYGTGAPVFLVTWPDGGEQAIRAKSLTDARAKADAALATRVAAKLPAPVPAEAPPEPKARPKASKPAVKKRTRYETSWQHPLTRQTHKLAIRHTRDYLGQGQDHLEIVSVIERQPHPLSATGYLSHFLKGTDLINAGGPVSLVDGMLAKVLRDKTWLAQESRRAQGDLFQWAEAQTEVTKPAAKSKPAAPRPARQCLPKLRAKPRAKPRTPRDPA